ncbi:hypothetical protein FRC01_003422 [Tulasnella sp. 417]|nr:hypothetical protein FRC01_003422 [Tulasnella sp. 417]
MTSIPSKGRPSLNFTEPVVDETSLDLKSKEDITILDEDEDDEKREAKLQEALATKSQNLIESANLGYFNWDVRDNLKHGYFNGRPLDPLEVDKLEGSFEKEDLRQQFPLICAVRRSDLESLGITLSKSVTGAPSLTRDQVESLEIICMAGQHRQAAAVKKLTKKEKRAARFKDALDRLEEKANSISNGVDGIVHGNLSTAEDSEIAMVNPEQGDPSEDSAGEPGPRRWGIKDLPELRALVEAENGLLNRWALWPVQVMDADALSNQSSDPIALNALVTLSSNKARQQNTGTISEAWRLVRPILSAQGITMVSRVNLSLKAIPEVTVDLFRFGPTRRLLYTMLDIPALQAEFQHKRWKRLLKSPAATFMILVLQGSLNNLLKLFEPGKINEAILSTLDGAYKSTIKESWRTFTCDLEETGPDSSLYKYAAEVKQKLQEHMANNINSQTFFNNQLTAVSKAKEAVVDVVLAGKLPIFSRGLLADVIEQFPKLSNAFIWAERYFSPDAPVYGSYTNAKFPKKRPDASFAVINEILFLNLQWRQDCESYDEIIPLLVPIVLKYGRPASVTTEALMSIENPQQLSTVDQRVYAYFWKSVAPLRDIKAKLGTVKVSKKKGHEWKEEDITNHMQGIDVVIAALDGPATQRLEQIWDDKKNAKSRHDLATHLLNFIWITQDENVNILKYRDVVGFTRGIMGIGVNRPATPCLIADMVPKMDAKGLRKSKLPKVDSSVWEPLEARLKAAGTQISLALADLPQGELGEPVKKWQEVLQSIREIYACNIIGNKSSKSAALPANRAARDDYLNRKKLLGAPPMTCPSPSPPEPKVAVGGKGKQRRRDDDDSESGILKSSETADEGGDEVEDEEGDGAEDEEGDGAEDEEGDGAEDEEGDEEEDAGDIPRASKSVTFEEVPRRMPTKEIITALKVGPSTQTASVKRKSDQMRDDGPAQQAQGGAKKARGHGNKPSAKGKTTKANSE